MIKAKYLAGPPSLGGPRDEALATAPPFWLSMKPRDPGLAPWAAMMFAAPPLPSIAKIRGAAMIVKVSNLRRSGGPIATYRCAFATTLLFGFFSNP